MPGKSKLTADAAEQATLRALSKSEHRGEADRARAILLTLEGRRAGEIAAVLGVHISTVRNWQGYFAHGGKAFPSLRQLAQDARMSLASVSRYMTALERLEVFQRQRKPG